MTENQAKISTIAEDYKAVLHEAKTMGCSDIRALYNIPIKNMELIVQALEEIQQYRAIGTVEELLNAVKEEDILKFYYCESEDSYLVGIRIGNFYYAHWDGKRFIFDMSRNLPWGEHVVDEKTAWKEYTYPSKPKEMDFSSWLQGFIKKECGGTIEECRAAVEKQKDDKELESHDEKHILKYCINLMWELVGKFEEWYKYVHGEDAIKELDEQERFCYKMSYFNIVQELFLFSTSHSGGTSTRAKCKQLGVDSSDGVEFSFGDDEE